MQINLHPLQVVDADSGSEMSVFYSQEEKQCFSIWLERKNDKKDKSLYTFCRLVPEFFRFFSFSLLFQRYDI